MIEQLQPPGIGMAVILGLLLALGNLTALASVRLAISGRIGPDAPAGIRTNATRASLVAWEAAHRAAWPWALVLHGLGLLAGLATMLLGATVAPFLIAACAAVCCTAIGAVAQFVVGHRAAQRELDR